jgi:transposase, IS30 family
MSLHNITFEERLLLEECLLEGLSKTKIATLLKRNRKTLYLELKNNSNGSVYSADYAQYTSDSRKSSKRQCPKTRCPAIIDFVLRNLKNFAPDIIAVKAFVEQGISISCESIYTIIYNAYYTLDPLLPSRRRKRKKRKRGDDKRGKIIAARPMKERTKRADMRIDIGHIEADTIVGKNHKGAIVTLVDKATCFAFGALTKARTAQAVKKKIVGIARRSKHPFETITSDCGKEFAFHSSISKLTGAEFFFADPGCPYQRGQNENFNRILRRHFPKGTDFTTLSHREVFVAIDKINKTPRKSLNYKSPYELFYDVELGAILI